MTIPKTVTQISVGSSDQVWALDANSNIVYYRNPITRVFEAVIPNDDIELKSIDVSYQGHVLALGTLGELYVWDSNARKFVPHKETLNETFDTISAGSNAIWATKQVNGETKVFNWNSDSASFVEIPIVDFDVKSLTVGKRDDATIVLSTDGALYKYDYSTQIFEEYVSDVGIDDLTALTASSEDNIWALDADGVVYQFNSLGGPEDVGGSESFVEKSTALGLETTDIAQFATDDKEILYSVHDDALSFHDTSDIRIQNLLSEEHYDVAIKTYLPNGKDQPGTIHYAYSTDDGLFHSFNYNGQWIRSVPISGAGQATEIDIDFDKDGNVYIAWIEGLGNAAKAFVAVGEANTGYAGYVFHDPVPISEDNVEDKSIDLEVTDGGIVTITTTKIDDNFRHDDHDVYSYSLQRNDLISARNQPEIIDLEGKIVEHSDLDHFVGLGLNGTPLELFTLGALLSGMGFEWTSAGGAFTVRAFVRERFDFDPQDKVWNSRTGIEVNIGFDFATINRGGVPVNEGPLKSLKLSMLLQPSATLPFEKDENGKFNWEVSTFLGASLEAYVDFTRHSKNPNIQPMNLFDKVLKTESDYQIGLFMELDGLWKAIQAGTASPALPTTRFPTPPFEIIDTSTGQETDANSAPENVVAQAHFLDMVNWVVNMALTPLGVRIGDESEGQAESSEAEPLPQGDASSDLEATPIIRDEGALVVYLGPYFKLSRTKSEADSADFKFALIKSFELEGRAAGFVRFESNEVNPTFHLDQAGLNTVLDIKLNKWFWRPLDLNFVFYQYEEGVEYSASAPGSYEYTPGGNMDVYDPGALAFGGSEDGTQSDTIDRQGFTYVLGKQVGDIISAHGLFIEDATGPVDGMYDLVYSIDGEVNIETGKISWFEDTKTQIGDSAGFNTNPTLALRDDGTLVAAWGNTSTDSAAYQAINDTPPGRAYFISGSDLKRGGSLDLSKLGSEPKLLEKSFYFSNDENLFSIGASVAQLGDINTVNGNGNPDFAFGAPDALNEKGRAYIIYGEDYTRVSNIDTLDGKHGFLITGLEGDEIGTSIHSAGLYNDDDIPDFAISAPGAFDNAGAVYIIYGGHDDLWEAGGGQFTADQVGGEFLPGEVIVGGGDDDRFGTAIAGGYDITGDGAADLAIGSIYEGTITLVSRTRETPVVIDANVGGSTQFQGPDGGYTDLGSAIAMLSDANEDGLGDLLIGSSSGTAYVLFGNERLESYSDNYVVSWQMNANRSMIVSFNGTDKNGDGILSAGIEGEIDVLTTEFYENGKLFQTYTINQQVNKDEPVGFNYDIASGRVLVNSPVYLDDPENEVYGIRLGTSLLVPKPNVNLFSSTQNQIVWESEGFVKASVPVDSNYFSTISVPVSFDLDSLSSYKGAGITFSAATALPLAVADAGDVNGDTISDFILGYDQSVGDDDDARPGKSYVVYGGEHLTEWEGEFDLDNLTNVPELGFIIEDVAGGRVAAAGDIDGDGYGDLIVSAPFADNSSTGTERVGTSFVVFGSEPGEYDPADNITISNDTANELAGSSIASLGDVDLDGRTDLMLGAPQEIRLEDTYLIYESTKLKYATKSVDDDAWNLTENINGGKDSETPLALEDLAQGTLVLWVDIDLESGPDPLYTLMGSFYNGGNDQKWSGTGSGTGATALAISEATPNPIQEASIGQISIDGRQLPVVMWIATDLSQSQSTAVYQSVLQHKASRWDTPEPVNPVRSEVPVPPSDTDGAVIENGGENVSVADVHAHESDGSATFVVTRSGDLNAQSETYHYRLADYSAMSGEDWVGDVSGSFAFAPGESTFEIDVTLLDDDLYEGGAPLQARLELWSESPTAVVTQLGVTTGEERITALLNIEDSNKVLNLASIDSGFQMNGALDTSLGYAFEAAGDVNGDGYRDFMLSSPSDDSSTNGKVYLVYGGPGVQIGAQNFNLDDLTNDDPTATVKGHILTGGEADSYTGTALAGISGAQAVTGATPIAIGAPGTVDDGSEGRVYVVAPDILKNNTGDLELDPDNVLEITSGTTTGDLFGRAVYLEQINAGTELDLVIASLDEVYVIYDVLQQAGAQVGSFTLDDFTNKTVIKNSNGTGFGTGLTISEFDGDSAGPELIVGSDRSNALLDDFGGVDGRGGAVTVIRGTAAGYGDMVDVADIQDVGIRFLGQAERTSKDLGNRKISNEDGGIEGGPRPNMQLVDGIGNAIATANFNGEGPADLIIGAPEASFANAQGVYDQNYVNNGRVYALHGGLEFWRTHSGDYYLTDIYKDDLFATHGVVFEGTEIGARTGASVANLGAFRGAKNINENRTVDDLAIGAPAANGGAGQAYAVLGSEVNFKDLGRGTNIFKIDPTVSAGASGALPIYTIDGQAEPLSATNTSNQGSVGFDVAGIGDITSKNNDYKNTGGNEFAISAPRSDVDGVAKAYVATGHPWILAGSGLEATDLRSDNGFVNQFAGTMSASGDFDNNGFSDFLAITKDEVPQLIVTKGASIYDVETSTNRDVILEQPYELKSLNNVAVGDFDGDGYSEAIASFKPENDFFKHYIYELDDLSKDTIAGTELTKDQLPAFVGSNENASNFYTVDLNGDGYDDLIQEFLLQTAPLGQDFNVFNTYFLNSGDGTNTFTMAGVESERHFYSDHPVVALGDMNADGKGEVLIYARSERGREIVIGSHNGDGFTELGSLNVEAITPRVNTYNVFGPGSVGDVNGDGYDDTLVTLLRESTPTKKTAPVSLLIYGAGELSTPEFTLISPNASVPTATFGDLDRYRFKQSDIIGDVNGDGLNDILIGGSGVNDSYIVYGATDLPDEIILPNQSGAADFDYGFAIRGIGERVFVHTQGADTLFAVGDAGDLNGDGLSDFFISDRYPEVDLTYAVYGERKSADPDTDYIVGTPDNDVIYQTINETNKGDTNVNIVTKEGDDFVQVLNTTRALVYTGEGDDIIGLGSVDGTLLNRIDGGTGWDTVFLDDVQLSRYRTLDLTVPANKTSFANIEVLDLGANNAVVFDGAAIERFTGPGNLLIIKGTPGTNSVASHLKGKNEKDRWIELDETDVYDGDIFRIFRYLDEDDSLGGIEVWIQANAVEWGITLKATDEDDVLTGTAGPAILNGLEGDDLLWGFEGDDTLEGGPGADIMAGGLGNDRLNGGADADLLWGDSGADEFFGTPDDLNGDLIRNFGWGDEIVFTDLVAAPEITVMDQRNVGIAFDTDADGSLDGFLSLRLAGPETTDLLEFTPDANGYVLKFANPTRSDLPGVDLSRFADGIAQSFLNGTFDPEFLIGDGEKRFEINLIVQDQFWAGYDNALGAYEIAQDGSISDVRILYSNVKEASASLVVDGVDAGHQLGFFLLQNAAPEVAGWSASDTLSFVNFAGEAVSAYAGEALYLARNGMAVSHDVFHSFDPILNADGQEHVISGASDNGNGLIIAMEDLTGLGDRDFEDVVFSVDIL